MLAKTYSKRPKHLNLFQNQTAFACCGFDHPSDNGRAAFFPGIPLLLCIFQNFLGSVESFENLQESFQNPLIKLILLLPIWFFFHHLCAGIRYLALDLHIGIELPQARAGAYLAFAMGVLLTILTGWLLW